MPDTESLGKYVLILVAIFGTFIAVVSLIPAVFLYPGQTYTGYSYPDYFTKEEITKIAYFQNDTIAKQVTYHLYDFSGDGVDYKFHVYFSSLLDRLYINRRSFEFWVFWWVVSMNLETEGTTQFTRQNLVDRWDSTLNVTRIYPVFDDVITVTIWVTDPNTTRNDIGQAWDDGSLDLAIGFGIDDATAKTSGWDLIGRLLLFQDLELFYGTNAPEALAINTIIFTPFWAIMVYVIIRIILLFIPFVG